MPTRRLRPALLTSVLAALAVACGDPPKVVPPGMTLSAAALAFSAAVGGAAPAAQDVLVTGTGGGTLGVPSAAVAHSTGSGWLTATVSGSASPYTVTVRASPAGLGAGTYLATVAVASVSAANSPQEVAVTLVVSPGMQVTRLVAAWGEDGAAASAAPGDVTSIAILEDGGAAPIVLVPGTAPGTWNGAPPTGPWWARVAWADGRLGYYRGSGLSLDLGEDEGGRPGRQQATAATEVTLDLTNLDPWTYFSDSLVLFSWGAQARGFLDDFTPGWPLFGGEDALSAFPFDWMVAVGPLLTAPDELYVAQLRPVQKNLGGGQAAVYQRAVAWTTDTGLAMADGQPFALAPPAMTLLPATAGPTMQLDWERSAFEVALPNDDPRPAFAGHQVGVYATPAPLTPAAPLGALAMPLLLCTDPSLVGEDFDAGAVAYGRFLPARYQEYLHARYARSVDRRAPGATAGLPGAEDLVQRFDAMTAAPAPIRPLLSAATGPTIDGADALAATGLTGVALAPTLAWQPPATGTPTSYRLDLVRLTRSGTTTVGAAVAELVVDGATTALALPDGLLQGGATYVVRLSARSSPTDAGAPAPLRTGVPFGEAAFWTVPFTTVP